MNAIGPETFIYDAKTLEEKNYWVKKVSAARGTSNIVADFDRPADGSSERSVCEVEVPEVLHGGLKKITGDSPFLLYTTLMAALKVCLHKHSGSEYVVVGSPALKEFHRPNAVAIVDEMDGGMSFRQLLLNVRETLLEAYARQNYPFHQLVNDLKIEKTDNRSPLFDVALALEDIHGELPPLRNDLLIRFRRGADNLTGEIEFNSALFRRETVERFKDHLLNTLRQAQENTDTRLCDFDILTAAERQQLLYDWNQTATGESGGLLFHQLFEAQAARFPEAVAVSFQQRHLTYRELNARSNQLAHHLRALGVGPEVLVGLILERSIEMVVALLGILKAGGAYLPLDPSYPTERLAFMLEDAQVPVLVTEERLLDELPTQWAQVVALDTDSEEISQQSTDEPRNLAGAGNTAYVIYTSGSTGMPKGVVVTHRGMSNLAHAQIEALRVDENSRVLQFASLSFDASISEIMMALVAGAGLFLEPQNSLLPGEEFIQLLRERSITTATLPPSLLASLPDAELPDLRTIVVAGEACPAEVVERWAPGRLFINAYGPTEATVCATMHEVRSIGRRKPSIGRAIANTEVYLLDQHLRPVPVGVAGELLIGGIGLARGYLGRAELTAERFIPHPFSTVAGERLYRTGDLARYLPTGEVEYLGRIDHQVKVRGFRIELEEIEATLDAHPAIRESVVVAREDQPGDTRLVAYFICEEEKAPTTSELHGFLKQKLPAYMVPSVFVLLEDWPLTPNGKVDRRALPLPDQARPELEEAFIAPLTPVEQTLAEIWAEVLGVERVGIHDNFFELGGDSILSIQIITRANQAGLHLKPKQIFQYQTVAELALVAGTEATVQAEQGLVIGSMPLTPIQHWFFEHNHADPHHYNQSVLLTVGEDFNPSLLERAVQHLLVHHDALRLRFSFDDGEWRQAISAPSSAAPFSRFDFSAFSEDEQRTRIEQEAGQLQRSLSLEAGELVRVAHFSLGAGRAGRVLMVVHHLAVDGVSWRVLVEDVQRGYEQLGRGEEVDLGAKTTSWRQWGEAIGERAGSEEVERELGYWEAAERREVAALPVDFPDGANTVASERNLTITLDREETRALLQDVPEAYHTQINDVLLTALAQAVAAWSGNRSLLVDLEGHGREEFKEEIDLSRTVGWFTSVMPVLLNLGEAFEPGDALLAIKEQLRLIPNRGLGYGLLRYLSNNDEIRGRLASLAPAEVSFNYLGQFDQVLNESSLFGPARESSGASRSLKGVRSHLLEINGSVLSGQLQLTWTFSENKHRRSTVERLAGDFVQALRALISHCQSPEAGGYTPSDFPLAKLDRQELKGLVGTERRIEDIYPLSPLQKGLLFHTLYAPESGIYFTQLSYAIHTELDVAAFAQAWQQVLNRHAILRTAFMWEGLGEPLQVVRRRVNLPWEQHDWTNLSTDEQEKQFDAYIEEERLRSLDMTVAPMMRLSLIRLARNLYRFTWHFHHLLMDGWSMSLIFKEVFAFYEAFTNGRTLQLEAARPYRDYIAWIQRQDMAESEAFWRRVLEGFSAPTPLPVDRFSTTLPDQEGGRDDQRIKIPSEQMQALQALARKHQLTLNTLVQGAWALLLSRYSGEEDVVFGATVSGRPATLSGVGSIVGPFINTLPVRARLEPNATVVEWLKELQAQQVEARQYEFTPLVQVQGWSDVPRGQSLFETVLVFENYPVDESVREAGESLEIRDVRAVDKMNYPLALVAMPGKELHLRLAYDTQRLEASTVTRMLEHLRVLLEAIAAKPTQRIAGLPLLTEPELQQTLVEWNDTATALPPDRCFQQMFEEQVLRTPDRVALSLGDEQLTYRELNERANQTAHHLRTLGVGPDVIVGLLVERSLEMVVSLLGIMKAGGAYLPLDPSYPLERLSYMLSDASVAVLVTQEHLLDEVPTQWAQIVCVDTDWDEIARQSTENPACNVEGENLAYVIYTSGSTGKPKGVQVAHRGLCNLSQAQINVFGVEEGDRVLQLASLSFDASIFEIAMALRVGATLCLVPRDTVLAGPDLAGLLEKQAINNVTIPPSVLASLPDAELTDLRTIVVAGEACPAEVVERWAVGRKFFNAYGPTEATVWSSVSPCEANGLAPSIGRAIANTEVYLLDQHLRPVPVGVAGELLIGGIGLARGYLGRAELTAERFIPHPFSTVAGERLYRTGDLARYLPTGEVEYLGRIDHQVKVRGFRIELGEIETALLSHPQVRHCIVVAKADRSGEKRLVAYLVRESEQGEQTQSEALSVTALREHLRQCLPDYMLPAAFVEIEQMPLNSNGKIDRRALPEPEEGGRIETSEQYVGPRTRAEEVLCEVWAEVLGVERVGIDDDFFALGGDSIRSVQVLAKAQQQGLRFSLQQLFEHQSVRRLAEQLSTSESDQENAEQCAATEPFSLITEQDFQKLPTDVEDAYPLTMLQAGMLFHSEYSPESALYHSINSFRLRAPLSVYALGAAVRQLVERHAILRTSFDLTNYSEPLQLVHREVEVPVEAVDLREMGREEQERELREWLEAEKLRHFDWRRAPLLRVVVHALGEEEFQFTFTAHHGIIDGWSDGLFLTELFKRYLRELKKERGDKAEELEEYGAIETSYREYVRQEREALASEESEHYWRKQLDESSIITLPRRAALPKDSDSPQFSRLRVPISAEVSDGLKRLAREAGVPVKSVLLAAHLRVMSLLSGDTDVVTGVVTNGRPESADGEKIIGLFLNTLPLRMKMEGGSWRELVAEVFGAEKEMLRHRRYPMAAIQRLQGGERLFEVAFNFTHFHVYQSLRGFDEIEVLGSDTVAETNFTLMVNFDQDIDSAQVYLDLDCDAAALATEQIDAIGGYYSRTLSAMSLAPHQRYDTCQLLSPQELHQQLVEWNDTSTASTPALCIHQLFEAQVERTPESVALLCGDEQVSYRELNRRANQLARHLRGAGAGAETLVGVMVERSVEMVVALLGTLKAGAAYVPIDPQYPRERISFMLEDAGVKVLLTQSHLEETLPVHNSQVVSLDAERDSIAGHGGANLDVAISLHSPAYVIYTSGSTGQPKGVVIPHSAILNHMLWMESRFPLSAADRVLQKTPFSFDASVWEFYAPLLAGATLVMARPGGHHDSSYLVEVIRRQQVSILQVVPSLLRMLLAEAEFGECRTLRRVFCGGESLGPELVAEFAARHAGELHNLYGPTEACIDATHWRCEAGEVGQSVPIGRPVANTQVYILDGEQRPVPVGVSGELCIGGAGLARGYWRRPELTAERFIPDPFSREAGGRLYRTGDLARYQPEGRIEYMGRIDHQVKLRGYRIELGEIETVIGQFEGVGNAVVVAREDVPGDTRLVAYVVPQTGQSISVAGLRGFMKETLPVYMVPSVFMLLDELPLTPNGKVNRRALPTPELAGQTLHDNFVAPRTPTEEMVAGVLAQVLGIGQIGVHDNFFELGGHSLLATQAISRLRECFRQELPLRMLFETPTAAGLAAAIDTACRAGQGYSVPSLSPTARDGVLPLSYAQQRLWFASKLSTEGALYNIPSVMRLKGLLDVRALEQSIGEIVRRHESLRTTFTTVEGQPVQVIAPAQPFTLPLIDLSALPGAEREAEARRLAEQEVRKPFDLERGPLMRASLVRLSAGEHVMLFSMHHIISDGWSMNVLVREVGALYEAFSTAQPSPLAELPVQYADYAVWQREWLQGEVLDKQFDYWMQKLGGDLPSLELPTDRPRPATQSFRAATLALEIPGDLTEALRQLSRQEGVTMFMTLLAAFQALLHRYTNQEDIVIGTLIAGRNRSEVEGLIGFFVNQLVLRTDLSGDPSFSELLGRVREDALGAYANQDMPFEKLIPVLEPKRQKNRAPIFQTKFTFETASEKTPPLSGLAIDSFDTDFGASSFDLVLSMLDKGDRLGGMLTYSTDLFDAGTIQNMILHYQTLLESIVLDPAQRLSALRLLREEETGGLTPADFPEAELSEKDFENLFLQLGKLSLVETE